MGHLVQICRVESVNAVSFRFRHNFRRRIEKLERVSLALIRLAYTSVPEGKREASTFRLERSHPVAAIADMEDIPVLTASIRLASKKRNSMLKKIGMSV